MHSMRLIFSYLYEKEKKKKLWWFVSAKRFINQTSVQMLTHRCHTGCCIVDDMLIILFYRKMSWKIQNKLLLNTSKSITSLVLILQFSWVDILLHFQHGRWMIKLGMTIRGNILSVEKSCIIATRFENMFKFS